MLTVVEGILFREDSLRRRAEQIFSIGSGVGIEQMKEAYRRLVLKYHPDRNPSDELSNQKMQLIHQAYNLVMNGLAYGGSLEQYSLLEDDRLVKSILPDGVEPAPLVQSYKEWHRKQFYEGFLY